VDDNQNVVSVVKEFIKEFKMLIIFEMEYNKYNKYILMPVKFTTLLAKPLVLRVKLCFQHFRRVKNNASNLRRSPVFSSDKCEKRCVLDSK
jgi:hypothetical protein